MTIIQVLIGALLIGSIGAFVFDGRGFAVGVGAVAGALLGWIASVERRLY